MKWILIKNKYKVFKWAILYRLFPKYTERKVDEILKPKNIDNYYGDTENARSVLKKFGSNPDTELATDWYNKGEDND